MKNCVYRFINENNEIIYIGKAKDLKQRLNNHNHLPEECYKEKADIQYVSFNSEYEMDFAERYFIPKVKPKYNTAYKYKDLNMNISEFDNKQWLTYDKNKMTSIDCFNQTTKNVFIEKTYMYKEKIKSNKEIKGKSKKCLSKLRPIICLNTNEIFNSIKQAKNKYNMADNHISEVCSGKRRSAGVHPETKEPLVWMYIEDYNASTKQEIDNKLYIALNIVFGKGRYRKVVCLNTGEMFDTVSDALRKYNMRGGNSIAKCCRNKVKFAGKHPKTKEPLVWRYLEDYENMTEEEIRNATTGIQDNRGRGGTKFIICLNTGEVFNGITKASEQYNITRYNISKCINKKQNYAGEHPITGERLVWMYLDEYEERYGKIDRQIS